MRTSFTLLLICFCVFAFAQNISIEDFKLIESLKVEVGESRSKKKAKKLEELYIKHNNSEEFQNKLFAYLKSTDYKHINNYFWFALYFMSDSYCKTIDLDLAITLLQKGKIEFENRLKKEDKTEEQELYLNMGRCQILWQTGIYYFNADDIQKGGKFFDKAYENSDCIHAFPAPGREKKKVIYEKYAKYREAKKKD